MGFGRSGSSGLGFGSVGSGGMGGSSEGGGEGMTITCRVCGSADWKSLVFGICDRCRGFPV